MRRAAGIGWPLPERSVSISEAADIACPDRHLADSPGSLTPSVLGHLGVIRMLPSEVLRLLAKRNSDVGDRRTQVVARLHALLVDLDPGGIATELNASVVDAFVTRVMPEGPVAELRYDLAVELLGEIRTLDAQLKASHKRIRTAVAVSETTVTELFGVGPVIAAMLIGYTGDIGRFRNRDHYAAYNGTAPVEFSSAGRTVHRVSQRGNRQLNHAIHMAAISQLRHPGSAGRVYVDRRVAEGTTKREAIRALKRHLSNAVYRQLVADTHRVTD